MEGEQLGRERGRASGSNPFVLEHRGQERQPAVDDSAQESGIALRLAQRRRIDLEEQAQVRTRVRVGGAVPEPPHPGEQRLVGGNELATAAFNPGAAFRASVSSCSFDPKW